MFLLVVLIGLLVFIVLRIQMLASEMAWVRRYLVRVMTQQLKPKGLSDEHDAEDASNSDDNSARRVEQTSESNAPVIAGASANFDFGNPMVNAILQAQVVHSMSSHGGMGYEELERDTEAESAIVELEDGGNESVQSEGVGEMPEEQVEDDDGSEVSEGMP